MDIYRVAREMVVAVGALKIADRELRDQATRAASSALLQLSEGLAPRKSGCAAQVLQRGQGQRL